MKNSGEKWIGSIPDNWEVTRGRNVLNLLARPVLNTDSVITCFRDGEVTLRSNRREEGFTFSLQEVGYQGIEVGDLVVHGMDGFAGAIGISDSRGKGTPVLNVLDSNQDKKYLMYYLRCAAYCGLFLSLSTGIRVRSCDTNWNKLKNILYLVPPIAEQRRIADFLDKRCAEIDGVIEATKKSIEEYKALKQAVITEAVTKGIRGDRPMKDSGIEWIGEIPEEWIIHKGKWVLTRLERPVEDSDGVITCFRDGEVTLRSNRREEGFTFSLQEAGYQGIEMGDLVVHGMDGFAGAIGISDSRGKGTPVLNVLDSNQNKRYVMYYLRYMAINGIFLALATGIRVRSCDTNWNKLKELPYILPPREEQTEIARCIDIRLEELHEMIEKKTNLLNDLDAYKKSVIYECVTGKMEV